MSQENFISPTLNSMDLKKRDQQLLTTSVNNTDPSYNNFFNVPITAPELDNVHSPLGRWDIAVYPDIDQSTNRGDMQPAVNKWFNGLLSRTASIVPKVGQGLGHVIGAGDWLVSGLASGGDFDIAKITDNDLSNFFADMDESLRERLPVHKGSQYANGNIWSKMGTAEFWADDAFDGLAYAASAYVPGAAISKLGSLGKLAGSAKLLQATKLGKALNDASKIKTIGGSAFYNTISEAGVEAKDAYDTLLNEYLEKKDPATGQPMFTLEEAKQHAGNHAGRVFGANVAAIFLPNLIQSTFFHAGDLDNFAKKARDIVRRGNTTAPKPKDLLKDVGLKIGEGIASEGLWEENIQGAIQHFEKTLAKDNRSDTSVAEMMTEYMGSMRQGIEGFKRLLHPFQQTRPNTYMDEATTSAVLGGFIGAGMGAFRAVSDYKGIKNQIEKEKKYWDTLLQLDDKAKKLFINNITEALKPHMEEEITSEDGTKINVKKYLDENQEVTQNPVKMANFAARVLRDVELIKNMTAAAIANNPLFYELNKQSSLAAYAWHLRSTGASAEDIKDLLELRLGLPKDPSIAEGDILDKESLENNKTTIEEYLNLLSEVDTKIGSISDWTESEKDNDFKNVLRRVAFYEQVKIKALKAAKDNATMQETKDQIDQEITKSQEIVDHIYTKRGDLHKTYSAEIGTPVQTVKRLNEVNDKLKSTTNLSEDEIKAFIAEKEELEYLQQEHKRMFGSFSDAPIIGNEFYSASLGSYEPRLHSDPNSMAFEALSRETTDAFVNAAIEERLANNVPIDDLITDNQDTILFDPSTVAYIQDKLDTVNNDLQETLQSYENSPFIRLYEAYVENIDGILNPDKERDSFTQEEVNAGDTGALEYASDIELVLNVVSSDSVADSLRPEDFLIMDPDETNYDSEIDRIANNKQILRQVLQDEKDSMDQQIVRLQAESARWSAVMDKQNKEINRKRIKVRDYSHNFIPSLEEAYYQEKTNRIRDLIRRFKRDEDNFDINVAPQIQLVKTMIRVYTKRTDLSDATKQIRVDQLNEYLEFLEQMQKAYELNKDKRLQLQIETEEAYSKELSKTIIEDADVKQAVINIVGKDSFDSWQAYVNDVLSSSGTDIVPSQVIEVLLGVAATKGSEAQINSLKHLIYSKFKEFMNQEYSKSVSFLKRADNVTPEELSRRQYPDFIARPFNYVHSSIGAKLLTTEELIDNSEGLPRVYTSNNFPIYNAVTKYFFLTQDLELFAKEADRSRFTEEYLNKALNFQRKLVVTARIFNLLDLEKPMSDIVKAETEAVKDEKLFPNLQQVRALRDFIAFATSKNSKVPKMSKDIVVNISSLKGIFGTGKSKMVAERLVKILRLLGIKKERMVAVAHTPTATVNIANATGLKGLTLDELLTEPNLKDKYDFIILDESFAPENEKISELLESIQDTKVIALGDPGQNRSSGEASPLDEVLRSSQVSPLTAVMRATNPAIPEFAELFRFNSQEVTSGHGLSTAANLQEALTNPNTRGVISGTTQEGLAYLKTRIPESSKIIIVNNQREADQVRASVQALDIKNLQVLTYYDVQSLEADHVVILLTKTDGTYQGKPFPSNREFNSAMATAISRAKSSVFMVNHQDLRVTYEKSTTLEERSEELEKELEVYKERYITSLETMNEALKALGEKSTEVTTPEDEKEEEEENPEDDVELEDDQEDGEDNKDNEEDEEDGEEEEGPTPPGGGPTPPSGEVDDFEEVDSPTNTLYINFPQTENFKAKNSPLPEEFQVPPANDSNKSILFFATLSNKPNEIQLVVGREVIKDGVEYVVPVGVISRADMDDKTSDPLVLKIIKEAVDGNKFNYAKTGNTYTELPAQSLSGLIIEKTAKFNKSILYPDKLSDLKIKRAKKIDFRYQLDVPRPTDLSSIVKNIGASLRRHDKNGNPIVEVFTDNVKVQLITPTKKEIERATDYLRYAKPGRPYYKITGFKIKTPSNKQARNLPGDHSAFYIAVNGPKVNNTLEDVVNLKTFAGYFTALSKTLQTTPEELFNSEMLEYLYEAVHHYFQPTSFDPFGLEDGELGVKGIRLRDEYGNKDATQVVADVLSYLDGLASSLKTEHSLAAVQHLKDLITTNLTNPQTALEFKDNLFKSFVFIYGIDKTKELVTPAEFEERYDSDKYELVSPEKARSFVRDKETGKLVNVNFIKKNAGPAARSWSRFADRNTFIQDDIVNEKLNSKVEKRIGAQKFKKAKSFLNTYESDSIVRNMIRDALQVAAKNLKDMQEDLVDKMINNFVEENASKGVDVEVTPEFYTFFRYLISMFIETNLKHNLNWFEYDADPNDPTKKIKRIDPETGKPVQVSQEVQTERLKKYFENTIKGTNYRKDSLKFTKEQQDFMSSVGVSIEDIVLSWAWLEKLSGVKNLRTKVLFGTEQEMSAEEFFANALKYKTQKVSWGQILHLTDDKNYDSFGNHVGNIYQNLKRIGNTKLIVMQDGSKFDGQLSVSEFQKAATDPATGRSKFTSKFSNVIPSQLVLSTKAKEVKVFSEEPIQPPQVEEEGGLGTELPPDPEDIIGLDIDFDLYDTSAKERVFTTSQPGELISKKEAKMRLKLLFPKATEKQIEEQLLFVDNLVRKAHNASKITGPNSGEAILGQTANAVITLAKVGDRVYDQVLYHEAMHIIWRHVLPPSVKLPLKDSIIKYVKEKTGRQLTTEREASEAMSELFQIYAANYFKTSKFNQFIESLRHTIKSAIKAIVKFITFGNVILFNKPKNQLNNLFRSVVKGKYDLPTPSMTKDRTVDNYVQYTDELFGSPENYHHLKEKIREYIGQYMVRRFDPQYQGNISLTLKEIYDKVHEILLRDLLNTENRFKALQLKTKPTTQETAEMNKLSTKILALKSTLNLNPETGYLVYYELLQEIFPSFSISQINEADLSDVVDQPGNYGDNVKVTDAEGITNETKDAASINWKDKQSKSMRLFLSYVVDDILYTKDKKKHYKFLDPGVAYIITMQLLTETGVSGNNIGELSTALRNLAQKRSIAPQEEKVINHLLKLIQSAIDREALVFTRGTLIFEQSDLGKEVKYHYLEPVTKAGVEIMERLKTSPLDRSQKHLTSKMKFFLYPEAKALVESNPNDFILVSAKEDSYQELYNKARVERLKLSTDLAKDELDIETFNDLIAQKEALAQLTDIITYLGSMKKTDYFIAEIKESYQKIVSNFVEARPIGAYGSLKVDLEGVISERINEYLTGIHELKKGEGPSKMSKANKEFAKFISDMPFILVENAKTLDDKAKYGKSLLVHLLRGLDQTALASSIQNSPTFKIPPHIISDLVYLAKSFPRTHEEFLKLLEPVMLDGEPVTYIRSVEKEDGTAEDVEMVYYRSPGKQWLDDQKGRIANLIKLLKSHRQLDENPSIISGSGNKIFTFHLSTFIDDVLNTLKHNKLSVPHLENTENLFVDPDGNTVHRVGEVDSFRNVKFSNTYVNNWLRLNKGNFLSTIFLGGFVANFKKSRTGVPTYFQTVGQQSNKPRPIVAEVNILNYNQIKNGIKKTFKLLASQIDISRYSKNYSEKFTNAGLYKEAIEEMGLMDTWKKDIEDDKIMNQLVDKVIDKLVEKSKAFAAELVNSEVPIQDTGDTKPLMANIRRMLSGLKNFEEEVGARHPELVEAINTMDISNKPKKKPSASERARYNLTVKDVLPLAFIFTSNFYVNSYHLVHAVAGTPDAYKNAMDIVKRLKGSAGPGNTSFNGGFNYTGVEKEFKALVVEDTPVETKDLLDRLSHVLFGKTVAELEKEKQDAERKRDEGIPAPRYPFDELMEMRVLFPRIQLTDGQAFITEKRFYDQQRIFGPGYGLSTVQKPLYYGPRFDNPKRTPVFTYLKMSSIVLTQDLMNIFPSLRKLSDALDREGIGEIYFSSAVKLGLPKDKSSLSNFNKWLEGEEKISRGSILTLSNDYYRMQLNPRSKADKSTALPTQLVYFMNVLNDMAENNLEQVTKLYTALSLLFEQGLSDFNETMSNVNSVKKFLKRTLNASEDERRFAELISDKMPIDSPMLEKKSIIKIASELEKLTTKVRFDGGKMVLQTSFKTEDMMYQDLLTGEWKSVRENNALKYTYDDSGNLVAEVVVPRELLSELSDEELNDMILSDETLFKFPHLLGFRIPSTELHSAVALKVVGIYDKKGTNVIIAPDLLVALHGSDFDVDSLFIARRPRNKETIYKTDVNVLLSIGKLNRKIKNILDLFDKEQNLQLGEAGANFMASLQKMYYNFIQFDNKNDIKLSELNDPNNEQFQNNTERSFLEFKAKYVKENRIKNPNDSKIDDNIRKVFGKLMGVRINNAKRVVNPSTNKIEKKKVWQITSAFQYHYAKMLNDFINQLTTEQYAAFLAKNVNYLQEKKDGTLTKIEIAVKDIINDITQMQNYLMKASASIGSEVLLKNGEPIGFVLSDNKYVFDPKFDAETVKELRQIRKAIKKFREWKMGTMVKVLQQQERKLLEIKREFYKGLILDMILSTISSPQNAKRMTLPVFKNFIDGETDSAVSILKEVNIGFDENIDLSDPNNAWPAFKSVSDGAILTGVFANAIKALAYMMRAGGGENLEEVLKTYTQLSASFKRKLKSISKSFSMGEPVVLDYLEQLNNRTLDIVENNLSPVFLEKLEELKETQEDLTAYKEAVGEEVAELDIKGFMPTLNEKYHFSIELGTTTTKDETTGEDVTVKNIVNIKELVQRVRSNPSRSIWDLLDALVNVAIDNVKDQGLPKINANVETAPLWIAGFAIGLDQQMVSLLVNQPIVHEITDMISKTEFRNDPKKAIRILRKQLTKTGTKLKPNTNLSMDLLKKSFNKEGKPFFPSVKVMLDLSTQETSKDQAQDLATNYLIILDALEKLYSIGNDVNTVSFFLSILNGMPVTVEDLETFRERLDDLGEIIGTDIDKAFESRIDPQTGEPIPTDEMTLEEYEGVLNSVGTILKTKPNFSINIPMFFKVNPHILSAVRAAKALEKTIQRYYTIHNPIVADLIDSMKLPIKLDQNRTSSKIKMRREFSKFVFSNIVSIENLKESAKVYTGNRSFTIRGNNAWSHNFANIVKEMKAVPEFADNDFLNTIIRVGDGIYSLTMVRGVNLDTGELYKLRKSYLNLRSQIQKELSTLTEESPDYKKWKKYEEAIEEGFVKYAVLNYGIEFGVTNFAILLPPELYLKYFQEYASVMRQIKVNQDIREAYIKGFKEQVLFVNADKVTTYVNPLLAEKYGEEKKVDVSSLTKMGNKSITLSHGKVKVGDVEIFYDAAYKRLASEDNDVSTEEKINYETIFPEYITKGEGEFARVLKRIVPIDKLGFTDNIMYYQLLGQKVQNYSKMSENIFYEGYTGEEIKFNPAIPTIISDRIGDNTTSLIVTSYYPLTPEETDVQIFAQGDVNKSYPYYGKVVSVDEKNENRYTIEIYTEPAAIVDIENRLKELYQDLFAVKFNSDKYDHYTYKRKTKEENILLEFLYVDKLSGKIVWATENRLVTKPFNLVEQEMKELDIELYPSNIDCKS